LHWLSQGAKCSPTVNNLFVSEGLIQGQKVKAWRPKKKAREAPKTTSQPAGSQKSGEVKDVTDAASQKETATPLEEKTE